ncbi:hypothetical protein [Nucisporomicrobium flavum]|uniref:hypothetical protein n=1 Tax=Nucisporomicrobium flavum TaxID=2785915 RepID=UPI0018F4D8B3|nr:hypothetical protein [Nucisporomicrobium flavum]
MPRIIRMPSSEVVRHGTRRRAFVEEMFRLYRAAGSPPLREIEEWIRANDELKGTASTETIRRILRGHVPPRWHTVEAIALAFFASSDLEPGQERWPDNMNEPFSNMDALRQAWAEAIEEDPVAPDPRARRTSNNFDDPWARAPRPAGSSFDDEPPF